MNINSRNKLEKAAAERIAVNTPVQGSAADIVKTAMLAVNDALKTSASPARLLLQVHDELIFKPVSKPEWWDSQTGFFCFAKYNNMSAPVRFLRDGINSLILDNANANIPEAFGTLDIIEEQFPIGSDFGIFTYNAALYHESYFRLGRGARGSAGSSTW